MSGRTFVSEERRVLRFSKSGPALSLGQRFGGGILVRVKTSREDPEMKAPVERAPDRYPPCVAQRDIGRDGQGALHADQHGTSRGHRQDHPGRDHTHRARHHRLHRVVPIHQVELPCRGGMLFSSPPPNTGKNVALDYEISQGVETHLDTSITPW